MCRTRSFNEIGSKREKFVTNTFNCKGIRIVVGPKEHIQTYDLKNYKTIQLEFGVNKTDKTKNFRCSATNHPSV